MERALLILRSIQDNADRVISQLIRAQFDDANWNPVFDTALKRFQVLSQGMEAPQKLSGPEN